MASEGDLLAGKYRLERYIGSGGFASVWAARNEVIDRPLALKVLSDTYARNPEIVSRFIREARIASRPIHPAVLRVEDVVQAETGAPFLVMELLDGHPLTVELKQRRTLSVATAVTVMRHVLAGLAAVHAKGIIHRDVKPSNIFLMAPGAPDPPVRILDLGVAKDLGDSEHLTTTGQLIGTLSYIAPEILLGDRQNAWQPTVDVFACGMVLFLMLTGRLPFKEDTHKPLHVRAAERVLFFRRGEGLPVTTSLALGVPAAVGAVLAKALAVQPEERYVDAGEMLEALDVASGGLAESLPRDADRASGPPAPDASGSRVSTEEMSTAVTPPSIDPVHAAATSPRPPPPGHVPRTRGSSRPAVARPLETMDVRTTEIRTGPSRPREPGAEGSTHMGWPTGPGTPGSAARPRRWVLPAALAGGAVLLGGLAALLLGLGAGPFDGADRRPASTGAEVAVLGPSGPSPSPEAALVVARPEPEPADGGGPPATVRMPLRGLPDGAAVLLDDRTVPGDVLEGPAGSRALLVVRAHGFAEHRREVRFELGGEVDLSAVLEPRREPSTKRVVRTAATRPEPPESEDQRTIDGRRPGSRIKVLSVDPVAPWQQ